MYLMCSGGHAELVHGYGLYVDSMCIGCVLMFMLSLYMDLGCMWIHCVLGV